MEFCKLIGRHFTVQMDNKTQNKLQSNSRASQGFNGQFSHLISTKAAFHSLKIKLKAENHKQAATEGGCSEGKASQGKSVFGDACGCRMSDRHWLGRIFFPNNHLSADVLVCAITFEPLKMAGICVKMATTLKRLLQYFCYSWTKVNNEKTSWSLHVKSTGVV